MSRFGQWRSVSFIGLLFAASSAQGYVLFAQKWVSLPVAYKINANSSPNGLSANDAIQAIDTSFQIWAQPLCSGWRATNVGSTDVSVRNSFDQETSVLWIKDATTWDNDSALANAGDPGIVLGVTPVFFDTQTKAIQNADIILNATRHQNWGVEGSTQDISVVGAQAVIAHEVGHLLGLDHSPDVSALMYYSYSPNVKTLRQDDIDGVCAKYPSGCSSGQKDCGAGCVDVSSDNNNCGGCGIKCTSALTCQGGSCACSGGLAACGGACVDVQTNSSHCGNCDHACTGGQSCSGGNCVCAGALTFCGGACVDTTQDRLHCGSCSIVCPNDGTCIASLCNNVAVLDAALIGDAQPTAGDAISLSDSTTNSDGDVPSGASGCALAGTRTSTAFAGVWCLLGLVLMAQFRKKFREARWI